MINADNLRKRLVFAAWGIPVGWWVVNSTVSLIPRSWAIVLPGQAAIVFLIIMASYEYIRMLSLSFQKNGFWISYPWIVIFLTLDVIDRPIPMRFTIFILLMLVAFEAIVWGKRNIGKWRRASLLFSALVFLYIAGTSMLNFYQEPFQSVFKHYCQPMLSQMGVVTVVFSVFICDSTAYFIGSLFGKHHYSTISPNKTVEGSIGGLIGAFISCFLCWIFFRNPEYSIIIGIVMGLLIGISAQAGDLLISLIKRHFQVKDASDLIPGHGGVLDRFGSLFFAAPTLGLFFWIVHKLSG
jgi:phosphatidate cytidylyltransferase